MVKHLLNLCKMVKIETTFLKVKSFYYCTIKRSLQADFHGFVVNRNSIYSVNYIKTTKIYLEIQHWVFLWVNVLTAKQTVIQYCEYLRKQNQREKSKHYNNFYMLFANRNKNIENISKRRCYRVSGGSRLGTTERKWWVVIIN